MSSKTKWRFPTLIAAGVAIPILGALIAVPGLGAHTDMNAEVENIVNRDIAPMAAANGAGGVAAAVRIAGRNLFFNYGFADRR